MKCPTCHKEMQPLSEIKTTQVIFPVLDGFGNPWLCEDSLAHRLELVGTFNGDYDESYFNGEVYQKYEDFPAHEQRVDKLIRITHPKSVLDVGCAYGYIVKRLLDKGIDAWGCDVSEYAESRAKEIIPGRFKRCPAWDMPYQSGSIDVIYCEGVLEHIPEDKIEATFKEFQRIGHRFYLQASLQEHPGVNLEPGHVCVKNTDWWLERIPMDSWFLLSPSGSDSGIYWIYKG